MSYQAKAAMRSIRRVARCLHLCFSDLLTRYVEATFYVGEDMPYDLDKSSLGP